MKKKKNSEIIHKMVQLAVFLAIGIVLNIVESFIPLPIAIPGIKLGLANTMGLILLYYYSPKEYIYIGFLRVFLVGLLRTGIGSVGFLLSLSGWAFATMVSLLIYITHKASIYGLSICSAMFHGTGQIAAYIIYMALVSSSTTALAIINYLPILLITGFVSGLITSLLSAFVLSKLDKSVFKGTYEKKMKGEKQ